MTLRSPAAFLPLLALLSAGPSAAAPERLALDPQASKVTFFLDSTLHEVHGRLELTEGLVDFDPETGEASGRIVLDALSATTFKPKRDKKMHAKVLESSRFGRIVFEAGAFRGALPERGDAEVVLAGTLSLHGDPHPFELPARIHREGEQLSATASFEIPYVDWGLQDPSVAFLRVDKVVQVSVEAQGRLSAAAAGR